MTKGRVPQRQLLTHLIMYISRILSSTIIYLYYIIERNILWISFSQYIYKRQKFPLHPTSTVTYTLLLGRSHTKTRRHVLYSSYVKYVSLQNTDDIGPPNYKLPRFVHRCIEWTVCYPLRKTTTGLSLHWGGWYSQYLSPREVGTVLCLVCCV